MRKLSLSLRTIALALFSTALIIALILSKQSTEIIIAALIISFIVESLFYVHI